MYFFIVQKHERYQYYWEKQFYIFDDAVDGNQVFLDYKNIVFR